MARYDAHMLQISIPYHEAPPNPPHPVANALYNKCTCMQPTYTILYKFFLVTSKPMIKASALLLAILWSCLAEQQTPTYPLGDVRNCPTSQPGNSKLQLNRMTVLPGIGFDNLRNIDMGQVFFYNYSTCSVSNDEKYLLPDSVFLLPILQSKVNLFSEYFDHWDNYTSTTSSSINLDIGYSKINAKFSDEYSSVKSQQVNSDSKTTRVQIRNRMYTVKLQPDSQLHPTFRSRLMDIAQHVLNQEKAMASYLAELVVREYGTHYLTSMEAGAVLMQTDHISSDFVQQTSQTSSKLTASASADFLVKVSISVAYAVSNDQKTGYSGARTSSQISSIGGPLYKANMTLNEWEAGVPGALVAIDRSGDPLHLCINPTTLPDLPPTTVMEVANLIYNAINRYYKMNTQFGCTSDRYSSNFNFQANMDDGSCKASSTNFAFGGVYQTCMVDPNHNTENLCPAYSQTNPLTGGYSCPSGYTAVNLHNGTVQAVSYGTICNNVCNSCGFLGWGRCCHCQSVQVAYLSSATYQAYWCAALGQVDQNSGFLFGGVFSSYGPNPMTGAMSCPTYFIPLRMAANITVCVSADYELGYPYSLPFGGFDSCVIGNPLAASASVRGDQSKWPSQCPQGYSQHVVALDEDCEINYCVKTGFLVQKALNPIKLPPFRRMPHSVSKNATKAYVLSANGEIWAKGKDNHWKNHNYGPADGISVIQVLKTGTNYTEYAFENVSTATQEVAPTVGQSKKAEVSSVTSDIQTPTAVASASIHQSSADIVQTNNEAANGDSSTGVMAWMSVGAASVAVLAVIVVVIVAGKVICKRWRKQSGYMQISS